MDTGIQILKENHREKAKDLLEFYKKHRVWECPEKHAQLLGYPYNKGDFEKDSTNGIRRIMVELKILSLFGKHCCPGILLDNKRS